MSIRAEDMKYEGVGIPENWQVGHATNPQGFLAAESMHDLLHKLARQPVQNSLQYVTRRLMIIGLDSLGAVTTLLLNGYSPDALRITRTIWEAAVTVAYLKTFPAKVSDFHDFSHIAAKQQVDHMDKNYPEMSKDISAERRAEIEADYQRVKPRFLNSKKKLRNTWSDKTIFDMAKATGREELYKTFYRFACGVTHLNHSGLQMLTNEQSKDVDIAPTNEFLEVALEMAHGSVLEMMADYNDLAELGFTDEIKELVKVYRAAWD